MLPVDRIAADAGRMGLGALTAEHGAWFLVRERAHLDGSSDGTLSYETTFTSLPSLSGSPEALARTAARFEARRGLRVASLRKRPDTAFSDRISVGRATLCDVVLRAAVVSKLHAHFYILADRVEIVDQRSSNGTRVNGVQLQPTRRLRVTSGSRIDFGGYEVLLLSVEDLLPRLRLA